MKQLLISLFILTASLHALAEDKSVGCGLGSKIAPKQSLISAATRAIVNAYTSNTSSMTSGTSGCAYHSIVKNDKRAIHYTEVNYDVLEMEIAQGQGEFLNGFASVLGCDQASFARSAQRHYNQVVPQGGKDPAQLLQNVGELIRTNPELAGACHPGLS